MFVLSLTLSAQSAKKSVTLYWDVSLAMEKRDLSSEFAFLDTYFTTESAVNVQFKAFNTSIVHVETFDIENGNWSALKQVLVNSIYDGTTSYAMLFKDNPTNEYLLFTDAITAIDALQIPNQVKATVISGVPSPDLETNAKRNFEYINVFNPEHFQEAKTATISGNVLVNKVSGTVSDETGPLEGVNVIIQNAQKGAVTDRNGFYSLQAKTGDVLVYSYLGKKAIRINVTDKNVVP